MEFSLSKKGYAIVYRDGEVLGQINDDLSAGGLPEFWKGGVYTQPNSNGNCAQQDATAWFKNFTLTEVTVPSDVAPLPVLSTYVPPSTTTTTTTTTTSMILLVFTLSCVFK